MDIELITYTFPYTPQLYLIFFGTGF